MRLSDVFAVTILSFCFGITVGHYLWPNHIPPQLCAQGSILIMNNQMFSCIATDEWKILPDPKAETENGNAIRTRNYK